MPRTPGESIWFPARSLTQLSYEDDGPAVSEDRKLEDPLQGWVRRHRTSPHEKRRLGLWVITLADIPWRYVLAH